VTAPAGWYPDPHGAGRQRYFDGESWTEHRQPPGRQVETGVAPSRSISIDAKVVVGLVAAAVLVIAVVAVGLFATLRPSGNESTVIHTQATETSTSLGETAAVQTATAKPVPTVGERVRDGNFAFVVAGVQRVDAVADPEFPDLKKAAAGEYLIVRMTVTNVGSQPQTFFASFDTLSDGTTTYRSDDEAWIYLGNTLADLNPGDSIDTAVVFDVPDGTRPESIELHDGPLSDGVTVKL
jgi:Domain of unknown function (DUF4352)/Protein of unknown function (DUF2510)